MRRSFANLTASVRLASRSRTSVRTASRSAGALHVGRFVAELRASEQRTGRDARSSTRIFDAAANTSIWRHRVPRGVAVSATPNAGYAYITNQFGNSVSVINPVSNSVVTTITVGNTPFAVAIA
jgi:YVTN family beta-propeller protein